MGFNNKDVAKLLAACHRRCCVCHRFCGIKMELDHMVPSGENGSDDIDNAIPVCFECHAEIHLYNDNHPRGRKFRPDELRLHKKQWLDICKDYPMQIVDTPPVKDVGSLHSLIDELEFNATISNKQDVSAIGCPFEVRQFDRAVHAGLISLLEPQTRDVLYDCYLHLKRANERLRRAVYMENPARLADAQSDAQTEIMRAGVPINQARNQLLRFLSSESESLE